MTYIAPTFRQGTIAIPSASVDDIVFYGSDDPQTILMRSSVGGYVSNGKTNQGATLIGRATSQKPHFVWTGEPLIKLASFAHVQRMESIIQNNPLTQVVLTDEFEYVDGSQTSWHNRTVITGSTTTISGLSKSLCSFNIFLNLTEDWWEYRGNGWYKIRFSAEEIIN